MLELIVLGIIPGTSKQLTLNWIAGALSALLVILALLQARHHVIAARSVRSTTEEDETVDTSTDLTTAILPAQA